LVRAKPLLPANSLAVQPQTSRSLNRASAIIATSVLVDSAIEHYRGSFHNKTMFVPIVSSALSLLAGLHGNGDRRSQSHLGRDAVYGLAAITGLIGTGMHVYNIAKRPGGVTLQNLFYAAPVGAPAALVLSGLLGFAAERLRGTPVDRPALFGMPAGRALAALVSAGILGTVSEAGLLHYRGAYQNPCMFLPVTVPPVAAALLGAAALSNDARPRRFTKLWLVITALLGLAGSAFHMIGVSRHMGGWRNWRQTVLAGPPIPAPPAFTGLALAGLAALRLIQGRET
jgi:hypothetical protein